MNILHICAVQNNMTNGATVAAFNHISHQALLENISVLYLRNEKLIFDSVYRQYSSDEMNIAIADTDLVVFHEVYYMQYMSIYLKLKEKGIPYIVIPHGGLTESAQKQKCILKKLVNTIWVKDYINSAISVQFLSQREQMMSTSISRNGFVLSNGIDIPNTIKDYNLHRKEFVFGFIGRLDIYYKGLDYLLEACSLIVKYMKENNILLKLFGPSELSDKRNLEKMIMNYNIEDVVSVHGPVMGDVKKDILFDFDVFIQTSRSEGQPMGLLEAMSYGLPLLVTPGTGFADEVQENSCGWVTDLKADSISNAMKKAFLEKSKISDYSVNSYELVKGKYDWNIVAQKAIKQYKSYIDAEGI